MIDLARLKELESHVAKLRAMLEAGREGRETIGDALVRLSDSDDFDAGWRRWLREVGQRVNACLGETSSDISQTSVVCVLPYYQDEMWCDHCDKDTQHKVIDSGHERDSSGDWRECLECHWTKTGHGEYEPPTEDEAE